MSAAWNSELGPPSVPSFPNASVLGYPSVPSPPNASALGYPGVPVPPSVSAPGHQSASVPVQAFKWDAFWRLGVDCGSARN